MNEVKVIKWVGEEQREVLVDDFSEDIFIILSNTFNTSVAFNLTKLEATREYDVEMFGVNHLIEAKVVFEGGIVTVSLTLTATLDKMSDSYLAMSDHIPELDKYLKGISADVIEKHDTRLR